MNIPTKLFEPISTDYLYRKSTTGYQHKIQTTDSVIWRTLLYYLKEQNTEWNNNNHSKSELEKYVF